VKVRWSEHMTDDEIASHLLTARMEHRTLTPISAAFDLSLGRAYRIQQAGTAARLAAGERIIGWKLGYTSLAMREQMGVREPNFGPLFSSMVVRDGDDVGDRFTQPKVEPEIAVVIGREIATPHEVRTSIASAHACLEVVDSVFTDYAFTLADNTADGSSAAGVVCGLDLRTIDLASVAVELCCDDSVADRALGRAASGDPLSGVEWLVTQLAAQGKRLRTGDFVITGGLTAAVDLLPGRRIEARFSAESDVAFVCVRRGGTADMLGQPTKVSGGEKRP
jgi:2-keto-4-pentenoate hydratase